MRGQAGRERTKHMSERHDSLTKLIWNSETRPPYYQAQQTELLSLILDELQEIKGRMPVAIPIVLQEPPQAYWSGSGAPVDAISSTHIPKDEGSQ